jgi:Ca-activated chloride channel family protein
VKTKAIIPLISLLVVAIALFTYFSGCSSTKSRKVRAPSPSSEQEVWYMMSDSQDRSAQGSSRSRSASEPVYPKDSREIPNRPALEPGGGRQGDTELDFLGGWDTEGADGGTSGRAGDMMGGMGAYGGGRMSGVPLRGELPGSDRDGDGVLYSRIHFDKPSPQRTAMLAQLASVTADEIWVIAKDETPQAVGPEYGTPGSGAMLVEKGEEKIPLPLKHTDVKGRVCGYIATVEVTQQFQNPFSEKIEAVYVFPLPQNAAVNEFIMAIGDRRIRGIIRERQEAEEIYREARSQGYVASLLTQERPNIFTQKVANIEPGKQIDVNIKYFNTLAYADGWYEFVFPMVVGPRFNPPGSTDGVGAVGRGKAGISGQSTEVQYLKPNERSGHDIALALDIDAGVRIEEIACASHAIKKDKDGAEKVHVQLSDLDNIPNKDFVLRFKVAGDTVKSALVTHQDERGGFFTLMLYPPAELKQVKRAPMEMVFVLDCSGSMNGRPIAKAKDAIKRALRKLEPDDTFQVIQFSVSASQLGANPIPATGENVRRAIEYVDSLKGGGGTMMIEGIKAALDFPHDPRRFRLVSFMTDGYIGNEAQILGEIHQRLGSARIFSFGVGTSVNRYLLDRMAKLGKGAVAYIGLDDSGTEVVDLFYDRISHPALTDVQIDWGDLEVAEVYPRQVPDLFVGRPIILTGRFKGTEDTTIRITGRAGQYEKEVRIPVELDESGATHPGIACVWARKRIEDLATQATYDSSSALPAEIMQVALQYSLMSAYTAFVAVDSTQVTAGDHGVTVAVPVPVPEGVRYDTTVQD